MKYIRQFMIIILISFVGEVLHYLLVLFVGLIDFLPVI